jgi:predicted phosphate transport protein (TIGR00153 family)
MFNLKISLFARTRELEHLIDRQHDKIIEMAMMFKDAIDIYLKEKRSESYRQTSKKIKTIEQESDRIRRDIERRLYEQNLIPDMRGSILQLVENLDKVVNLFDEVAHKFYIERPDIPEKYHNQLKKLVREVSDCAENMAISSRAFFRDLVTLRDYSKKVYLLEHQSDKTSAQLRNDVFDSDLELAQKIQINTFVEEVADIADLAEDCIDALLIFAIKREI